MNEKKSFVVREYLPGDETGIVQLVRIAYPIFGMDLWRWKYEQAPLKPIIVVAESEGKIIGCNHNIVLRAKIGAGVYLSSFGDDLVVDPNFRRKGIGNEMHNLIWTLNLKRNVKFQYADSYNPITIEHFTRHHSLLRKPFPYPAEHLYWIRDAGLHFRLNPRKNSWLMKLGLNVVKSYNRIGGNPVAERNRNISISDMHEFDENVDAFWNEVSGQHNFMIERKKDYLNWKYCGSPRVKDMVRLASEDGKIVGYSVLNINKDRKEYPSGVILDLLALPGRLDVADLLVADALRFFEKNGVNMCSTLIINKNPYEGVLMKRGFVNPNLRLLKRREKMRLFYVDQGIGKDIARFENSPPSGLHFSYGDIIYVTQAYNPTVR